MDELELYDGAYAGPPIDEAIGKVLNPDASPTTDSTNLVESGGVASALSGKASIFAAGTTGATAVTIQLEARLNIVLATRGDSASTFALAFRYNSWQIAGTNQSGVTLDSATGVLTIPTYTHYKILA